MVLPSTVTRLPGILGDDFRPDLRGVFGDTIVLVGGVGGIRGGDGSGVKLLFSLFFMFTEIVTRFGVLAGFRVIRPCFISYFRLVCVYFRSFSFASLYDMPMASFIDLPLIFLTRSFI